MGHYSLRQPCPQASGFFFSPQRQLNVLCLKEMSIGLLILGQSKCSAKMQVVGLSKQIISFRKCSLWAQERGRLRSSRKVLGPQIQQRQRVALSLPQRHRSRHHDQQRHSLQGPLWVRVGQFLVKANASPLQREDFGPASFHTTRPRWVRSENTCTHGIVLTPYHQVQPVLISAPQRQKRRAQRDTAMKFPSAPDGKQWHLLSDRGRHECVFLNLQKSSNA